MISTASAPLQTRSATDADLVFLDAVFASVASTPEKRFTYPACANARELLDELHAYGLGLQDAVAIVERSDEPLGCFGFLYEPNQISTGATTTAFLIGPLGIAGTPELASAMLDIAESEAGRRGLHTLRCCIAPTNTRLSDILTQRRWTLRAESLELKLESERWSGHTGAECTVTPLVPGDPRLVQAAQLVGDAFGWGADAARRLQTYLDDEYEVAYAMQDGELCGVAIWYGVEPFARIENIVVRSDRRRRGLGSQLLNAAVASLRSLGRETIYLALDPENAGARELYRRHGFIETEASAVYSLDLQSR